jgi:cell division protein FtsA
VTNDIAVALRTPTLHAEEIKINHACALTQLASLEDTIEVPSIGDRPARRISKQNLAEIVEPRYEELMILVQTELRRSGFEDLITAGVVVTGGSSKMEGLVDLAEEVFHMPVRLGVPSDVGGLTDVVSNPVYATGVGLLMFGQQNRGSSQKMQYSERESSGGVWARMKNWFQGNF